MCDEVINLRPLLILLTEEVEQLIHLIIYTTWFGAFVAHKNREPVLNIQMKLSKLHIYIIRNVSFLDGEAVQILKRIKV